MCFRGEPSMWFELAAQPRLYRWNKFRSSLETNFGSFGAKWESGIIKEFGNSTEDSSEGGLGLCESAGPSNAPSRDTRDAGSASSDEEDPKEDPEEETDGTKTQRGVWSM